VAHGDQGSEAKHVIRHDVGRALEQLRERDRRILWLAHVEEASHAEIAAAIGARAASVRVLLFRARRRLLQAMERKAS
jgi:RNA polymerase sigma-70 factor (ECF subfamily)